MVLSMERWNGKVAIVTGASSGIGAQIANRLVENGMKVVGFTRRVEKVEEMSKNLKGEKGQLFTCKVDITKEDDIINGLNWTKTKVGPVSVLINSAGVSSTGSLLNGDINNWKRDFNTNVLGLTIVTREAIKQMRENNVDGHIININSVFGHKVVDTRDCNVYPATKHAVTALTKTFSNDLKSIDNKVKVSSLSPGFCNTEMIEKLGPEFVEMVKNIPSLDPKEIADAAIYILSTPPNVQVEELIVKPLGAAY